ncbi:amino acid adenylation domain-containing protein/thioester reductase domain-containing protein [Streptoalloteichus tenebrarius]|uniref:Amino acid adenylation domain-containing protein/thioester reductase domain-containing protein n=1 Tax=Streptoalloteichus tenebrarius (strain ATCC 17920 / DSM 40477 / JCM 4838 / CBS 697.72 / NBRC 16177 / NCIMB 11028 / NRRL B-12390 / A12253. 1 / ISP 5477) TaxID=1933 RepID=A0ABT1HQM8_STRSD|nr:non-ribosomal peptide synthetase [Streptoalloteichus tenebrarius]MCP2257820.1 amino acid adenylation domain-containing protein/thioester reductase domain-containing protein [Streptoalloteichus tenebrarius]
MTAPLDQPTHRQDGTGPAPEDSRRALVSRVLDEHGITNAVALSPEQRRLLMLTRMEPGMPDRVVTGYRLVGALDLPVLQQGLAEVTRRHETLRSAFVEVSGRTLRVVNPAGELNLVEVARDPRESPEEFVRHHAERELARPFDPATGPLVRARLLRIDEREHVLVLAAHELVADEWTPDLLVRDLVAACRRLAATDDDAEAPADAPSYTEYARWRQERSRGEEHSRQLAFWRERLADLPPLPLPTDHVRPATKTYRDNSVHIGLSPSVAEAVEDLARRLAVPPETVVLTGFQVVLSRYARHTDVTVGVRTSVRGDRWRDLLGPAGNTVVLRTDLSGDPTVAEAVRRVASVAEEAARHGEVLFGALVDGLQTRRDVSRTPFFQVMFAYRDARWTLRDARGLTVSPYPLPVGRTAVDLALTAVRTPSGLSLRLDHNTDLHEPDTARRLLGHLRTLLSAMTEPARPVAELPLLTPEEQDTVLRAWNDTAEDYPADLLLHQLVEAQVARTPRAVAVSCGGNQVTYRELNERANQLAHHLRERGLGVEGRVAICLERSVEMVVAMLGVLKAGGAYVPLDPEYPVERLRYLLSDSAARILVTQRELVAGLPEGAADLLLVDEDWPEVARAPRHDPEPVARPDNLAYLIYTSGSTGQPKGVMLTHRGAVNNLTWRQRHWPLTADDRVLQNHSFSFDPSLWATFWPLLAGARTVVTLPGQKYDSTALVRLLREEGITLYAAVPSLNAVLMEEPGIEECVSVRTVQSGAEMLTGGLQRAVFSKLDAELVNFYGPTETTVDSTAWVCPRVEDPGPAPVGRPVANLRVHILDDHARPVPAGVPGHLCVGGVGLARGYHNRPGLTAGRFVPDPFGIEPGGRLYRTGDIGRYRPDGVIEFVGRADNQVKVRGYRIELGEVEAALARHPDVREAVALAREDTPGDRRLVGYVTRVEGSALQPNAVSAFLEEFLPSYMAPSAIVVLDEFPVTPNGKVDRAALPAPGDLGAAHGEVVPPRTPLEEEVAALFARALGVERVGVTQDFFELGGSSLVLARLASQLLHHFRISLPVHQLFKVPTVAGVAETVREGQRDGVRTALTAQHMTRLENDATLPEDIRPDGLPSARFLDPDVVLLTGATGYLGAFLLEQVLRRTRADVYCLVRARSQEHAFERLRDTMRQYLIWDDAYAGRIRPLVGDLGRPRLGLSEERWHELCGVVDSIYHCGATVNFVYPYSALRKPNVGGTRELLRLACTERLKGFHHVSTADVVLASHMPRPLLEDETALRTPSDDPGGYTGSKWVAEKIANIARRRGVPVSIYRPGLILGHTTTGATQPEDYLVVSFRGFVAMGVVPDYPRILDAVPVDYVAAAITHISLREEGIGEIYHLFNPAPVSIRRFCDWIRSFGYDFRIVPFEEARELALRVRPGHPLYSMVPLIRDAEVEPQRSLDPELIDEVRPELECRNTLRLLAGSGISCPPADERQAHLVLRYLVEHGHLESPEAARAAARPPS